MTCRIHHMKDFTISEKIKKQVKEILLISLIGIPVGFAGCYECWDNPGELLIMMSLSGAIWVFLWKGNEAISYVIDLYVSWLKYPARKLIIVIVSHSMFTVIAFIIINFATNLIYETDYFNNSLNIVFTVGIALLITFSYHTRSFFIHWRMLAVREEQLKKENISSKYEALKNQVNPHFLFNSLNTLTHLIYDDADQAAEFVKELSEVYRYVLSTRELEAVSIKRELAHVNSYVYLQKMRYGDALNLKVENIDEDREVPPLSIQMLVENAIKHNIISASRPLSINIYVEDGWLIVSNNLQEKEILEDKSKIGLQNIMMRYKYLTDREVTIEKNKSHFTVKLPLQ
ncbi:MAG: histidine kinase [Cyclobacteriaceae bacterium]|nr:histidine kinase [Cyclobacteriaceae bacterium]